MQIVNKSFDSSALPEKQLLKYKLPEEACELSKATIDEITRLVYQSYAKEKSVFAPFNWAGLLTAIAWNVSTKYGSLSKRVSKWMYDNYKLNLPANILQQIGIISVKDRPPAIEYSFDIVNEFNWQQGGFGDFDSCFFTFNSASKDFMEASPNFKALRFFKEVVNNPFIEKSFPTKYYEQKDTKGKLDKFYVGTSRAWLWLPTLTKRVGINKIEGKGILVFNAYGHSLEHMTMMLSTYLGLPYKEVEVTNQGNKTGMLYLNSTSYLIGDQSLIEDIKHIDLEQPITKD